jgi:dihydroneopterin aldolase
VTGAPDRIVLQGMRFEGHHGVSEEERRWPQPIEVDLELEVDLRAAGRSDELADTIDYGPLVALCEGVVTGGTFRLLEAIAETIADRVLAASRASAMTVRVRKLAVPLDAEIEWAGVEIRRERQA